MYEGFFFSYPEAESVQEVERRELHGTRHDWEEDLMARKSQVFERMILEEIVEREGEQMAAKMEYIIREADSGGFWNDPEISDIRWDEKGARFIARRAIETFKEQGTDLNEEHILEKAGLLDN